MTIKTQIFQSNLFQILSSIAGTNYATGLLVAVAILQLAVVYKKRSLAEYSKDGIRLPPGPPPRWFWSNALPTVKSVVEISFSMVETDRALSIAHTFTDFVRKYGPLVSFRQGSQVIIVIGSVQVNYPYFEFPRISTLSKSGSHGDHGKGRWFTQGSSPVHCRGRNTLKRDAYSYVFR
jgi:hypothetical protein